MLMTLRLRKKSQIALAALLAASSLAGQALAQDGPPAPAAAAAGSDEELAMLAKSTANPLSYIWMLWTQADIARIKADEFSGSTSVETYKLQTNAPAAHYLISGLALAVNVAVAGDQLWIVFRRNRLGSELFTETRGYKSLVAEYGRGPEAAAAAARIE
jgi:hypothetical protein